MKNQPMRDIQLGLVLNNQTVAQKYTNPKSASKYEFIIKIKVNHFVVQYKLGKFYLTNNRIIYLFFKYPLWEEFQSWDYHNFYDVYSAINF